MPHLSNSAEALHWDEASAKLTNVLKRLNGVGQGRIEWIERASYPRTDAPAPHDEERSAIYNREVLVSLAESVEALQKEVRALKSKKK
jgi:hypothetical protein